MMMMKLMMRKKKIELMDLVVLIPNASSTAKSGEMLLSASTVHSQLSLS